jgi:hypothetical protein
VDTKARRRCVATRPLVVAADPSDEDNGDGDDGHPTTPGAAAAPVAQGNAAKTPTRNRARCGSVAMSIAAADAGFVGAAANLPLFLGVERGCGTLMVEAEHKRVKKKLLRGELTSEGRHDANDANSSNTWRPSGETMHFT